jgi:hypothetical protein
MFSAKENITETFTQMNFHNKGDVDGGRCVYKIQRCYLWYKVAPQDERKEKKSIYGMSARQ